MDGYLMSTYGPGEFDPDVLERQLDKVPDGVLLSRCHDVIDRLTVLKHQPHSSDVVTGL